MSEATCPGGHVETGYRKENISIREAKPRIKNLFTDLALRSSTFGPLVSYSSSSSSISPEPGRYQSLAPRRSVTSRQQYWWPHLSKQPGRFLGMFFVTPAFVKTETFLVESMLALQMPEEVVTPMEVSFRAVGAFELSSFSNIGIQGAARYLVTLQSIRAAVIFAACARAIF